MSMYSRRSEDRAYSNNTNLIYPSNLGLGITALVREKEQGRFRGSIEGAGESGEGADGRHRGNRGGAPREQGGVEMEDRGA